MSHSQIPLDMETDPFEFFASRSGQPLQRGDLISDQDGVQVYFEGDEFRIVWNDALTGHHFSEENDFGFSLVGPKTTLFGP